MKNYLILSTLLFSFLFSNGQNISFTKADPQPDFYEVYGGSFASGDIDGDGDLDLLIAGQTPAKRTGLYINDGNGNFTEAEDTPFVQTANPLTIFEDLDGDGDLDLFFAGNGLSVLEYTHIYLNDGNGNFTELPNPSLPQFQYTGADIADVDGDGDKDLMIAVEDENGTFITDLFLNDGNALFSPANNTVFTPVKFSKVIFFDAENDGDADVIITGLQEDDTQLTALYLNDGLGNYTMDNDGNFPALKSGDMDVADMDNDGDADLLFSGNNENLSARTKAYLNDGTGQFSELTTVNLQNTTNGENVFSDLDNDGDLDLLIVGTQDGGIPNIYNIVYQNEGNNVFIPIDTLGGEYIATAVIDDYTGDGLADVIIQGFADKMNVYWNTSDISTSTNELTETSAMNIFPNPSAGAVTINLEGDHDTAFDLAIYNYDGRLVYQALNLSGTKTELDLDLISGSYIVILKTDQAVMHRKLVIVE